MGVPTIIWDAKTTHIRCCLVVVVGVVVAHIRLIYLCIYSCALIYV